MSETSKLLLIGAAAAGGLGVCAVLAAFSPRPLETFTFFAFGGMMVISALAILVSQNIVRCAVWLLGTLGAAAGLYLLLAANFLAAIQLIVYAGGILILIVFGIMLTAKNPYVRFEPRHGETVIAALVGLLLFGGLVTLMVSVDWPVIRGVHPAAPPAGMERLGKALLTDYLLPFELVSVLLLAVMIGAAYLARPTRK